MWSPPKQTSRNGQQPTWVEIYPTIKPGTLLLPSSFPNEKQIPQSRLARHFEIHEFTSCHLPVFCNNTRFWRLKYENHLKIFGFPPSSLLYTKRRLYNYSIFPHSQEKNRCQSLSLPSSSTPSPLFAVRMKTVVVLFTSECFQIWRAVENPKNKEESMVFTSFHSYKNVFWSFFFTTHYDD